MTAGFDAAYARMLDRWPDGTTTEDIESRFGITRVTTNGPVHDPSPVILLHGGGATAMAWTAVANDLARTRRIVAPNLIGDPGPSRAGEDRLRRTDDLVEWLDGIIDSTGANTVELVGHSYGAMIALAHAVRRPERVNRLVLVDPTSCFVGLRPRYLLRALPSLLFPNADRTRRFILWETDGQVPDDDWLTLTTLAADEQSTRPVVPKRPDRTLLHSLADHRVQVVLAPASKAHDVQRVAATVADSLPSAHVTMLSVGSHHMLPLVPAKELSSLISDR